MNNNVVKGFFIQMRVIHALIMREIITRYGRENIGFLWTLGEPLMFTSGIVVAWSLAGAVHGHAIGIVEFAVTGYSSVLLWRNCINRSTAALQQNFDLLVHRRISEVDIIVARSLLEIAGASMSFLLLSISLSLLGFMQLPADLSQVLYGWVLLGWTSIALSLAIGGMSEMSHMVEKIIHVATYLLFPLSGAVFLVEWLSPQMANIVLYIPMVNELELIREGWYGNVIHGYYSLPYVLEFNIVATLVGLISVGLISGKVERQ